MIRRALLDWSRLRFPALLLLMLARLPCQFFLSLRLMVIRPRHGLSVIAARAPELRMVLRSRAAARTRGGARIRELLRLYSKRPERGHFIRPPQAPEGTAGPVAKGRSAVPRHRGGPGLQILAQLTSRPAQPARLPNETRTLQRGVPPRLATRS